MAERFNPQVGLYEIHHFPEGWRPNPDWYPGSNEPEEIFVVDTWGD